MICARAQAVIAYEHIGILSDHVQYSSFIVHQNYIETHVILMHNK